MNEEKITIRKTSAASGKEEGITTKGLDFLISLILGLVFLLCPLFFTGLTLQGIGFDRMMFFYFLTLLGLVAWVLKGIVKGELTLKRTPLDWPLAALLVILTVATILSVSRLDSLIGSYGNPASSLAGVIVFILFYYLLLNNLNSRKIKIFFWLLVFSSALIIAFSLLQLFSIFLLPWSFTKFNTFNPLGSFSSLSLFLIFILPILITALAQLEKIHPKIKKVFLTIFRVFLGIIAAAALFLLILINDFVFWPISFIGIVIIVMFFLSKLIKTSSFGLAVSVITFLLLVVFLVLGSFRLFNLALPQEVNLAKNASWDIAKSSLKSQPIFGSGPSTFYFSFAKFKGTDFNLNDLWYVDFDSANPFAFEVLSTAGALGALAFLVVMLVAVSLVFLTVIKSGNSEIGPIALALFASLASAVVFVFSSVLTGALLLNLVLISIFAVSVAVVIYPEKFKEIKLSFRASPKYALALAAIFLGVSAGVIVLFTMGLKIYLADVYALKAAKADNSKDKAEKLSQAINFTPYRDTYHIEIANNLMSLANDEISEGSGADTQAVEKYLNTAISEAKKAVELNPNKYRNNESLALIYENTSYFVRGSLEWAEDIYKNKAKELNPDSPTSFFRLGLVKMAQAQAEPADNKQEKEDFVKEAIKQYDQALEKKSNFGAAYYAKSIAYENLNNLDEAINQMEKAVGASGGNLDYAFEWGRLLFNRGISPANIAQSASQDIAEAGSEGKEIEETNLSVEPSSPAGGTVKSNDDLKLAEQIFSQIISQNSNYANARYTLALLYQKMGRTEEMGKMVRELLKVLNDESQAELVRKQFPGIW